MRLFPWWIQAVGVVTLDAASPEYEGKQGAALLLDHWIGWAGWHWATGTTHLERPPGKGSMHRPQA